MDEYNTKLKMLYNSLMANTSAIWQRAVKINNKSRKLGLDQTSGAQTHTERNKCDKTRGRIVIILLGLGNADCTG